MVLARLWELRALPQVLDSLRVWQNLVAVWVSAFEPNFVESLADKPIHFRVDYQLALCTFLRAVVAALMSLPVVDAFAAEKRITLRTLFGFFDNAKADRTAKEVYILLLVRGHQVVDV